MPPVHRPAGLRTTVATRGPRQCRSIRGRVLSRLRVNHYLPAFPGVAGGSWVPIPCACA